MPLKPVNSTIKTKDDFINTAGKRTLPLPRGPRARKLSDDSAICFKMLLFGPTGSGKTRCILGLLLQGFKVFVLSTDIGGEGLSSVKTELRKINRLDLLANCAFIVPSTYDEVTQFLNNPESVYPEIYDEDYDFYFWDGFSGFQQNVLSEEIGQMTPQKSENNGKEVSEARESGLQFEQQDWGMVRNGTVRNLNKFLNLHNRKSGKVIHKCVTCLENLKAIKTSNGTQYQEGKEVMLQGAAQKLILPAFDLVINTKIHAGEEGAPRSFKYVCVGHDTLAGAKTRGIDLEPVEPGDMYVLWNKISTQLGITQGAVNEQFREEGETTDVGISA